MIANQVGGRLRQHDLAAVRGPAQPGRTVDDGAEVVALAKFGLAGGMAIRTRRSITSGHASDSSARCRANAAAAASLARVKAPKALSPSPLCLTSVPPCAATTSATIRSWRAKGPLHLPSVGLPESGRALHIGQHEGDRPTRQVGVPHFGIVRRTTASAAQKR